MPNFEVTVATLVENKLSAEHPNLVQYRQSFVLLDFDEDEQQAFGVYRLTIGSVPCLMPAVYRKGELAALDILIIRDTKMFVPAIDGWINVISTAGVKELGELMPKGGKKQGVGPSQVTMTLHQFPFALKTAKSLLTQAEYDALTSGLQDASAKDIFDVLAFQPVPTFVHKNASATELVSYAMDRRPKFRDYLADRFTDEFVERTHADAAMLSARRGILKKASGIKGRVHIITDIGDPRAADLRPSEKRILLKQGRFVIDHRAETETTTVWRCPESHAFETVAQPGRYEALMSDGSLEKVQVYLHDVLEDSGCYPCTAGHQARENVMAVVFPDKPGKLHLVPASRLWVKRVASDDQETEVGEAATEEAFRREAAKRRSSDQLSSYPNDSCTVTAYVLCGDRALELYARVSTSTDAPVITGYDRGTRRLVFTDEVSRVRQMPDRIYIPKNARVLFETDVERGATFGKPSDLTYKLVQEQGAKKLTVAKNGELFDVDGAVNKKACSEADALLHLVLDGGISAPLAANMLRNVRPDRPSVYLIRRAATEDEEAKALANLRREIPRETETALNQDVELGKKAEQMSKAAPQKTEDDDRKMLETLVDLTDFREITADQVRTFTGAMDEAGQMLLRILARKDEYEKRYGDEDADALEDFMRKQFTQVGSLVLFMREKRGGEGLADDEDAMLGLISADMA